MTTPQDLETSYGFTGGHIFHGELALDQLFTMRPVLDWARYKTPIRNLFLCGSGTHPGNGLTGGSGANCRPRNNPRPPLNVECGGLAAALSIGTTLRASNVRRGRS